LQHKLQELDHVSLALEERTKVLHSRNAQIEELDVEFRQYKHELEDKLNDVQVELSNCKQQLVTRNNQVGQLDEVISTLRAELAESGHVTNDQLQNIERLQRENNVKSTKVEQLEAKLSSLKHEMEDCKEPMAELTNEYRRCRQSELSLEKQLKEREGDVERLYKEVSQLNNDLSDMENDVREKDSRLNRLTSQITELQTIKVAMQSKFNQELVQMQQEKQKINRRHQLEIDELIEKNAQLQLTEPASSNRKSESVLINESLQKELEARTRVLESANHAIIDKEEEISRLTAKLSVLRTQQNSDTPTSQLPESKSDDDVRSSVTSSLMEADLSCLAPSFLPIATSTKRQQQQRKEFVTTARGSPDTSPPPMLFRTSSPRQNDVGSDTFKEEESMCRRLFGDDAEELELTNNKHLHELQEKVAASEGRINKVHAKLKNLKQAT